LNTGQTGGKRGLGGAARQANKKPRARAIAEIGNHNWPMGWQPPGMKSPDIGTRRAALRNTCWLQKSIGIRTGGAAAPICRTTLFSRLLGVRPGTDRGGKRGAGRVRRGHTSVEGRGPPCSARGEAGGRSVPAESAEMIPYDVAPNYLRPAPFRLEVPGRCLCFVLGRSFAVSVQATERRMRCDFRFLASPERGGGGGWPPESFGKSRSDDLRRSDFLGGRKPV